MGRRLGGAAFPLGGVSGRLDVQLRELAALADTEAGDRIVAAIGREQKPPIRREDDTTCTFKGVRRAVLTTDRLERPRSRTTSGATFHFRKRAARSAMIMYDAVLDLVRLHVEGSAIRRAHLLGRHLFWPHLCRPIRFSCLHLPLDCPVLAGAPARSSESP